MQQDIKVSIYPHIKETKAGVDVSFHDIFSFMKSDHWREKIEPLRVRISEGAGKEEIENLKSKLPYFTASGLFKTRNEKGIIKHSGKLAIDFDYKSNIDLLSVEKFEKTKLLLCKDKYSEYVFVSCSGGGLCVIADIDSEQHLKSFLSLEKYYKNVYGLVADQSCKDVSRPRYISWDDNLFHNPEYERFIPDTVYPTSSTVTVDGDDEKFTWVKNIHDKKEFFIEGNRHNYLLNLSFFLNKCGVSYEYTVDRLIRDFSGNGKTEKEIISIVKYCYNNTIDHGTFVINKKVSELPPEFSKATKAIYKTAHGMNEAGNAYSQQDVERACAQHLLSEEIVKSIFKQVFDNNKEYFNIDEKPEIYKVELFINKKYEILKNEVSQRFEYRKRGSTDRFELLNTDEIFREMMYAGFKFTLDKLKSIFRSKFIPKYNPFNTYFESLPEYIPGEEPDYISELSKFIKTDNDEFWKVQLKKALVRSIACSLDHKENRIIITLVGQAQETGKSNFIRFLCPGSLKDYYTETAMDGGKDSDMQLSENFIWNLEELAALHNNEVNKLKAIISKSNVKQRRAYAEFHDSNPRRVNFWASTNKTEFLTDDQNTRWLCFNVVSIDHNYNNFKTGVRKINIDNIWSQAYTLYKNGFDFNLTKEESAQRDLINKEYELTSLEKDLILNNYKVVGVGYGDFMSNSDILIELQKRTDNKVKLNIYAISKAMRQLEFVPAMKKIDGKTQRGYWVKSIDGLNANSVKTEIVGPEEPETTKPF